MTNAEAYFPGLDGVIAGETDISCVEQGQLLYRGYDIADLAEKASFEECAYLLLHGELPNRKQLEQFTHEIDRHRKLPEPVTDVIKRIPPEVETMDVLRTAVSMCGHFEKFDHTDAAQMRQQSAVLLAVIPSIIAARMRLTRGQGLVEPKPGLSHAAQFYYLAFDRQPSELEERILNLTLILYAEHEFNASAFAARVCTSTMSDLWSAIVAAIGTLKGPLHGGANEEAIRLINKFKSADEARNWTLDAFKNKVKVMGFGHRVYKNGDHRAHILEQQVRAIGKEHEESWKVDVYAAIKDTVWEQKKLHQNLDFPCGLAYYFLGLPIDIYTPLFVASRVSGWCAHVIEQSQNNRIIRPRSRYTGPEKRSFTPLDSR